MIQPHTAVHPDLNGLLAINMLQGRRIFTVAVDLISKFIQMRMIKLLLPGGTIINARECAVGHQQLEREAEHVAVIGQRQ